MRFLDAFASLLSVASLAKFVAADLRITADNFSFAGVSYPGLQTLNTPEQEEVIRAIVKSGARVIRLFSTSSTLNYNHILMLPSSAVWRLSRCRNHCRLTVLN